MNGNEVTLYSNLERDIIYILHVTKKTFKLCFKNLKLFGVT